MATYRFKIAKEDVVVRPIDLTKKDTKSVFFDLAALLNTVFMKTDSVAEEIIRAVITGKLKPGKLQSSVDKEGNTTLSGQVVQNGEKYQVTISSNKKTGDVSVMVTSGPNFEPQEMITVHNGAIRVWSPK